MSDYNHAMLIEQDKRQLHPLHHPSRAENPAEMVVRGDGVVAVHERWQKDPRWHGFGRAMECEYRLTSGYIPLGGMQVTDEIRDVILAAPADQSWMHGYTYSGHAAACAVGMSEY